MQPQYNDFYEELPTDITTTDEPVEKPVDEPNQPVKAHLLSPEEMEEWKNGGNTEPVLRHAADVEAETATTTDKVAASTLEADKTDVPTPAALPEPQIDDPGEYIPKDYSFEVIIYDAEGKNGKSTKISNVQEFDNLLEGDANFGSYGALAKAQRAADRMEAKSEDDYAKWERVKEEFEAEKQLVGDRLAQLNDISAEIDYLVAKGKLPAVSQELKDANWSDPEIAGQAGVKEQIALLKYMDKESAARRKAGLSPLASPISALREMQLEEAEKGEASRTKRIVEARKAAGAKVGGSAPTQATGAPKGIAVGRVSPGGLRDMGVRF